MHAHTTKKKAANQGLCTYRCPISALSPEPPLSSWVTSHLSMTLMAAIFKIPIPPALSISLCYFVFFPNTYCQLPQFRVYLFMCYVLSHSLDCNLHEGRDISACFVHCCVPVPKVVSAPNRYSRSLLHELLKSRCSLCWCSLECEELEVTYSSKAMRLSWSCCLDMLSGRLHSRMELRNQSILLGLSLWGFGLKGFHSLERVWGKLLIGKCSYSQTLDRRRAFPFPERPSTSANDKGLGEAGEAGVEGHLPGKWNQPAAPWLWRDANCPQVHVWNEALPHRTYFIQPHTAPKRCSRMPRNGSSKIFSREEGIFLSSYLAEIILNCQSLGIVLAEVLLMETPPNTNRILGGNSLSNLAPFYNF